MGTKEVSINEFIEHYSSATKFLMHQIDREIEYDTLDKRIESYFSLT